MLTLGAKGNLSLPFPLLRQAAETLAVMRMRHFLLICILCSMLFSCSSHESVFIDDVEQSKKQLEKLDSSEIFSYTKYDSGQAPQRYYKGDDTIVIVVKTKKVETRLQKQRHALLNRFLDSVDNGADILIVQDGLLVMSDTQKRLRALSPAQLSNVDTLEWNKAKKLYGSPAKPITLIVNLYNFNDSLKP